MGTRIVPYLSDSCLLADHAASRAFPRFCGNWMTLPLAPSEALAEAPPEWSPRRLWAASNNSSASSAVASRSCTTASGARRGGNTLISLVFFIHLRAGRGATGKNPSIHRKVLFDLRIAPNFPPTSTGVTPRSPNSHWRSERLGRPITPVGRQRAQMVEAPAPCLSNDGRARAAVSHLPD